MDKNKTEKNKNNKLNIKLIFDSTKTEEYKGAHSIGCKN